MTAGAGWGDREVLRCRMESLLIDDRWPTGGDRTPAAVVEWFGAMQAQDLFSGLWSIGVRIPGSTRGDIVSAVDRAHIVRTWPMRGTLHWVPAPDARWMLEVLGARALNGVQKRWEYLGLDRGTVMRAADVLAGALVGGIALTRAECVDVLSSAGIDAGGQRAYHLLWHASQTAVICPGPVREREQAFALFDEWVPLSNAPSEEEALATIAIRYFRSHGPTTIKDFAGWTGLAMAQARLGVAAAGADVVEIVPSEPGSPSMFASPQVLDSMGAAPGGFAVAASGSSDVRVLPAFDEYLLGFKDRALMLAPGYVERVVPGGNGVFQPTIVVDGRVVGVWKRVVKRARVDISVTPLEPISADSVALAEARFAEVGAFIGLPAAVSWAESPA